ncbi:TonB-dependent receptor [Phenylobacterium sp.]|uniref:TonB-dependent receptor n=1 Tax=Phenylobacterium sp. TaxID=1871053 RepID=UPI0011F6D325|nr:TonB-dependent receptor [Phenylobacterium sp.]TAL34261.1 MAG: TonB-dependent receptor [Phenylobacterium sp.]
MQSRRRTLGLAGVLVALGTVPETALARETALSIAIPEQPRQGALMALARQAGVSMGFAPGARCGGRAAVAGRMDLDQALARLLDGSDCVAFRPDPRTVVIRARPSSRAQRPAEPPPQAPTEVGEVVVTADKTETLLSASPYGLTATSGAELERRGVADVRDLTLLAAGVTVTNLGPGRDKVLLRGLSDGPLTGHTQSTVGLYLGDLRLTYNAPNPDLPLIDLARVEVLRGPQGSLYGAGSIGGILQLVPRAPDTALVSGRMTLGASVTAHGAPSGLAEGVWNLPLAGGRGAARAVAWYEVVGGYLDNPRQGRTDVDRSTRRGLRVSGLWRAQDDLVLEATLVDQAITTRDAHYVNAADGPRVRTTTVAEPHDNDFLAVFATARWSPGWGELTASIGALDHEVGTVYDATRAPPTLVAAGGRPSTFEDGNEIRSLVTEVRVSSSNGRRLRLTAGVFNAIGDQRLDSEVRPADPAPAYAEVRRDRLREGAAFGEVSYDVARDVTLTVGGRLYAARLRTRSDITLGVPIRGFTGVSHDTGFAPKLLAAYRPAPGLTLYVLAAEGYRTAGFNTSGEALQVFGSSLGDTQPLRRYVGDELWSYEAGLRWRRDGLAVRAAAFQADWTDIQADLVLPSGLPFTANLGDGRSRGVEIEGSFERGRLSLAGNLVWQDPDLLRPAPGSPGRSGAGLPGVPDLTFAASATYRVALAGDRDLDMAASYAYTGRSRLNMDTRNAAAMGGYGELRLSATVRSGDYSLRLALDNVLGSRGDTLAFGNPFTLRLQAQATPLRPRTLALRIARDF